MTTIIPELAGYQLIIFNLTCVILIDIMVDEFKKNWRYYFHNYLHFIVLKKNVENKFLNRKKRREEILHKVHQPKYVYEKKLSIFLIC